MTVAELIEELRRHPAQKAVHVVMPDVVIEDESGSDRFSLHDGNAIAADQVVNAGPFILIRGRRQ